MSVEADAAYALHEDAQRAVGNLDHLVDDGRRADGIEVVPAWLIRLGLLHSDECEHAVAGHDVLDQLDRAFLSDGERCHRLREDDGVLQRQHGQRRREGQLVLRFLDDCLCQCIAHLEVTTIEMLWRGVGRGATGNRTVSRPRSYVAVAASGSTSSSRVT